MANNEWQEVERLRLAAVAGAEEQGLDADVLCAKCTRSVVFRRKGKLHVSVYCHSMEREVPPDIAECSNFREQNRMDLDDMNRIALKIDPRVGVNDKAYA